MSLLGKLGGGSLFKGGLSGSLVNYLGKNTGNKQEASSSEPSSCPSCQSNNIVATPDGLGGWRCECLSCGKQWHKGRKSSDVRKEAVGTAFKSSEGGTQQNAS